MKALHFLLYGKRWKELIAQSAQYDLLKHNDYGYFHFVQKAL